MEFVDRQLTCMDCSQPFVFTAGEQEFYERKGFKEEPKRCKNCREARKSRRNNDFMGAATGRSNGNGSGHGGMHDEDDNIGNRASRGPREVRDLGGGGGRGGAREMFEAVCAQCGVQTRVPFKPVAGRPVYCRECYSSKRGVGL